MISSSMVALSVCIAGMEVQKRVYSEVLLHKN
jgi:hypothetical protein